MGEVDHQGIVPAQERLNVLNRDAFQCRYCEWPMTEAEAEIDHLDGNHGNNTIENLVTCCPFCHDWHHLGRPGIIEDTNLVWAPDFTPAQLINFMRASFVAKAEQGSDINPGARVALSEIYTNGENSIKEALGAQDPAQFGACLVRLPFAQQPLVVQRLAGMHLVPSGVRKSISGADRFPDIVASWSAEGGAFEAQQPKTWKRIFNRVRPEVESAWKALMRQMEELS